MNKAKALAWFSEVEAKDPGPWSGTRHQNDHGFWNTDDSAWKARARAFVLAAEQVLKRTFAAGDPVVRRWDQIFKEEAGANAMTHSGNVAAGVALFREAHSIVKSDRLDSLIEGVRAETVAELLDQAEALLSNGWLSAAMVTAGGAVESTLRHLCANASPPIVLAGHGSIEKYNSAIGAHRGSGTDVLTVSQSKMVTVWGDHRNRAAHYPIEFAQEQTRESVKNAIDAIRMFLGNVTP